MYGGSLILLQPHIKKLKFVPITIDWLTDGKDTGLAAGKKAPEIK